MSNKGSSRRAPRRAWRMAVLVASALIGAGLWWVVRGKAPPSGTGIPITVYASPTCGCCHEWVKHLRDNGFDVTVVDRADVAPIKRQFGVPDSLWSCHTAMVHSYAVEGHVPADLLVRLVRERPQVAGLAVPGMPRGSPGMEGVGKDAYQVLAFSRTGATWVYADR